jgi:Primase X
MQIPLEDYRKNPVSLILAPYLINIRKISPDQSNQSLIEWLERCNAVRRLDFRPRQHVKDSIKTAMKVKIPPLRLETLRSRNPELHRMIVLSIIE